MSMNLWEIKPQIVACLSLRSHCDKLAQAGRDNPGQTSWYPVRTVKKLFYKAMKDRWDPLKCVEGQEKDSQRRKRRLAPAFKGSFLATVIHSCLKHFLSIIFTLYPWSKVPFPLVPFLHFLPSLFFLSSSSFPLQSFTDCWWHVSTMLPLGMPT